MEKVLIPSGNKMVEKERSGGGVILINDGFSLSAWSAVVEWFCLKRGNIEILHLNFTCTHKLSSDAEFQYFPSSNRTIQQPQTMRTH